MHMKILITTKMSTVNLDLDFQDYSPTSTGGSRISNKRTDVQVKIPTTKENKPNIPIAGAILGALQSGSSQGGLSDETLQQLLWLSGKERNKQQRSSISSNSNWLFGYLAQYFDTTTDEVLQRILWSIVPIRKRGIDLDTLYDNELIAPLSSNEESSSGIPGDDSNSSLVEKLNSKRKYYSYVERFIQSRPDLYGPFWLSTTLIFAVTIFSNILSFAHYRSRVSLVESSALLANHSPPMDMSSLSNQVEEWHYSMEEMSMMTSVVMLYVLMLPSFLWFLFWFQGCTNYYTLTEMICAYGYSLSIFIPLTILFMIENTLFRYITLTMAGIASGIVLTMSFLPVIRSNSGKGGLRVVLIIVPVLQLVLAFTLHKIMSQ